MIYSVAHIKSFLYSIRCMDTANMSLSVVVLLIILTYVSGDTDSIGGISDKVTCRDVMKEMRSLFEKIERNQNSMQEQVNNIAAAIGLGNDTATDKQSLKTKINNVAMIVRSLEQSMASVQYDVREVKSVTLGKL